jgi:hypothetical protein
VLLLYSYYGIPADTFRDQLYEKFEKEGELTAFGAALAKHMFDRFDEDEVQYIPR